MNNLIYLFCITNTPPPPKNELESQGLVSLVFDEFYVIVKYVSDDEFSEENLKKNISDIKWLELNALEHVRVISQIMDHNTAIPFKFGTIYNSEEGLRKFVSDYSDSISENIQYIYEKEEWSLKIFCDRKALGEKIDELSTEASELEKQIMASSPGKAFLLKRKKTDLVENEMDRLCKSYGQLYYDEFRELSEATGLNNLLPKEYTGREDTMILNATFLVNKTKVKDFRSTVERLKEKDLSSGFFIETTGPWPPFSFISIKEK
jgi:hypothetical protein